MITKLARLEFELFTKPSKSDFLRIHQSMFGNFLYFIIVLLIYTTYQPSEETNFAPLETLSLFFSLIIIFTGFTWIVFRKIKKQIPVESFSRLDHLFHSTLTRQSIVAVMLFAINIYGLNLTLFLADFPLLELIPTIQAVLFLGLFVFYLAILWACAYATYQKIFQTGLSRRSYVLSNISLSIPVLLPWLLLSGIADIIYALPFELPKQLLSTNEGQGIYFLIFLFGVAIISPAMIQKFWRCKPLENGYKRERIENLCQKANFEYRNILYWPIFGGMMITAGVMGLIKRFRYILVTGALLRFLEPEEIDAVIAHEIGHIKRKHLIFYLFFLVGYLLLSYATFDLIIFSIFYTKPIYRFIDFTGLNPATVTPALFSLVIIILFLIYFRYIFGYFMRNFERQADIYVYELFDSAHPLISTLKKIAITSRQSPDKPNWHHFSIKERIAYLNKCETDKKWIAHHNRKVKKSIAAYLAGILVVAGVGYQLNYGETGKKLNQHFFEKMVQREIAKTPDQGELYSMLGDLYYSNDDVEEAAEAYEKALDLNPDNPRVLNNLAWLYATCEKENIRNPKRAVILAQRAVNLKTAPHILDTLAESYYVNDEFEKAVAAERRALEIVKKNRVYYENQLKRFLKTAE
ncbi:MAG: M48 family metalloprotease [Deltaproteobacteria bacterium]|nr:M48 family metalloprotease [Deltaproteobacteria bacterium]MBW2200776.1 M48 family metalloprotease [Deltaproteobacteria bacterium]